MTPTVGSSAQLQITGAREAEFAEDIFAGIRVRL